MSTVIQVENLSKVYRLGEINTGYLTYDLKSYWARMRGKEDPNSRIDRVTKTNEEHWALKNVSFEVKQGEVLGIIGKNGAGKSTLLKVLSKITSPTSGIVKIKGRIASLLEVGTGFHPELTGRENIFLNGAILGMTKAEIKSRFDEIVDFSGVEKFIDTPVKRYSSGMYVRLAFAVAAHLEPEILIIDEVLAVGDVEFQKKCLGKMKDVAGHGRTVLFVSHNMVAVKALCKSGIILKNGFVQAFGNINDITNLYLQNNVPGCTEQIWENDQMPGNDKIRIKRVAAYAKGVPPTGIITTKDDIALEIDFYNYIENGNVDVTFDMFDANGVHVTHIGMVCSPVSGLSKGLYRTKTTLPGSLLNSNRYVFHILFGLNQKEVLFQMDDLLIVDIEDAIQNRENNFNKLPGIIHPICDWETLKLD